MRSERLQNALFVAAVIAILAWLSHNLASNLAARGINIDYGFLWGPTSFPIGESLISFSSGDNYFRALLVGLLNTVKLALVAIILSTVLGLLIGLAGRASHPQLRTVARTYIEVTRNTPLLLILVVCATAVRVLPPPRQAWNFWDSVFVSSRGVHIPTVLVGDAGPALAIITVVGFLSCYTFWRLMVRKRNETGLFSRPATRGFFFSIAALVGVVIYTFSWCEIQKPSLTGFNFRGGMGMTPEYIAMLAGLSFYTSGFIAEIVRGSLAALPKGQSEAAGSLGLSPLLTLYLVLAPQALRLMLPPLANQYLNTIKNTTLAVLIGYPDLVSVGNTALNQTGRAIETVSIYLIIYLTLSLLTSAVIRWLEKRAQLVKT
ncbi:amino ABC transporter, permease, 3-TM region, His/Glu/Gln/Arg/opine family domain protein (plasmid) [Ochrobactrum quorumnocens]|uniref:Amino ABC transporter, permease, 3-TM region, His/Glu/Gln/Arg/opine family domain protein n=1 Tax=Ochrobactrum quorumnocens TaxID=271865 RepID=A0A248UMH5_9HYPH|nr:ABC transporter permease subunit [[Ochrobactrum] quorumnocens]ASV87750.1 amino ABC transporter, permease, 3-TM region, His/Glu/Gln/Arg/opine family domain protein [[Ochrobactrum] quorumnocens]